MPGTVAAAPPAGAGAGRDAATAVSPVVWALRLALGAADAPRQLDWTATWQVALHERLALLCWLRSGAAIRRHAPAPIVERWRRHALSADVRGRVQLEAIEEAMTALDAASVSAALLKGRALAALAYGDPAARVSTDIDLFVKLRDRPRAATVLASLGWRRRSGRAPWDETWERRLDGCTHFLEVHSTLVHDTLAHHALAPRRWRRVDIGGLSVRTLDGPELPVYLAAHAVAHDKAALLWFVDLASLWRAMRPTERAEACTAARAAGLARHLDWAVEQAAAVERAAAGIEDALRVLDVGFDGMRHDRPLMRSLRLAPDRRAAIRVGLAWLWPRPLRRSLRATVALAANRATRLVPGRHHDAHAESSARHDDVPSRALTLDRGDLCALVREAVAAGAGVWVTVRGASMTPAIPPGSQVRLGPPAERSLRKGDVVLALLPTGLPVLHRVRDVQDEAVVLQGDALPERDVPVPRSAVIAVAEYVRTGGAPRPVPGRGARPWRRIARWWMHRMMPGAARVE